MREGKVKLPGIVVGVRIEKDSEVYLVKEIGEPFPEGYDWTLLDLACDVVEGKDQSGRYIEWIMVSPAERGIYPKLIGDPVVLNEKVVAWVRDFLEENHPFLLRSQTEISLLAAAVQTFELATGKEKKLELLRG